MDDSNSGGGRLRFASLEVLLQSGRDLTAFNVILRDEKRFKGI